ncbi:hypothetical protein [Hallella seregens]|uniref:Uncharacterized protein n=1 Tax=Hallella seregens ATCC 51272 TaxID=1336250 RepID=A0ABV5ZGF3_9BACT|nr:hypothetical protein [Hallella seregens]
MIRDKDEAMKKLAIVKGYLTNVAMDANQPVEFIKLHLTLLDEVQLFIDPKADLNKIQEEVNKK